MTKNEFMWNESRTSLINTAHIISLTISAPMYEQKEWQVVASLVHGGTQIVHKGDQDSCDSFLQEFYYYH